MGTHFIYNETSSWLISAFKREGLCVVRVATRSFTKRSFQETIASFSRGSEGQNPWSQRLVPTSISHESSKGWGARATTVVPSLL